VQNSSHLILDALPLADYPSLNKVAGLREVQFWRRTATDEKMEALARVGFAQLQCVTMNGSSHITDRGIEALARIPTVHDLGLEGASITDVGLGIIAARMQPQRVNVASCPNITAKGLLKLVQAESLKDLGFSPNRMTTAEVVRLLEESRGLERFQITGPAHHLDRAAIDRAAAAKARARGVGLQIVFQSAGSMQVGLPLPDK